MAEIHCIMIKENRMIRSSHVLRFVPPAVPELGTRGKGGRELQSLSRTQIMNKK